MHYIPDYSGMSSAGIMKFGVFIVRIVNPETISLFDLDRFERSKVAPKNIQYDTLRLSPPDGFFRFPLRLRNRKTISLKNKLATG